MLAGNIDDGAPQSAQVLAHLLDVLAHLGADFDLRAQQFGRYLAIENLFALTQQ
jgi:hypothetical protein